MKKGQRNIISYMKKYFQVIAKTIICILSLTAVLGVFYWYNNTLFLWEAKIIWAQEPFSELKFKNSSSEDRARMVVDLIKYKKLLGMDSNKVPTFLGEETGDDGKINRVYIRKSCCSISKKLVNL